MLRVCLKFCVFCLADIKLTCFIPERRIVFARFHSIRRLFYFHSSTGNIYKYNGKYLFRRISHASSGSKLQFFRINKHTLAVGIYLSCVTVSLRFFYHASEPLTPTSVLLLHKRASNYMTDNRYFSLLIF